ncbi:MAG: DUF6799 domain-containing protein [Bacteroidota bacterium]|nr:DUF6799 domain-containing protein [Bacteroidota bacterium]
MKTKKMISTMFASLLIMVLSFTVSNSFGQTKMDSTKMKDCCMMKNGKMMCMKDGKSMRMDKDMTMKNGTKCMTNGDCVMKDGVTIKMKEGECMDMNGKMDKCEAMCKDKKNKAVSYTCSMHPEVCADKPGKCSKCGMELTKKK